MSKKLGSILVEKKEHIGYIYFDNPKTNNRIGRQESLEMIEALKDMEEDRDIRVVILSGKGDYFCSGGKIDGFPDGLVTEQRAYSLAMVEAVDAMNKLSKPVIAAVNATALAGGVMFMEACDIAVTGKNCRFGLPEIQRGYFPMIALAVLQKAMPKKRLLEMAFTGELVTAETMLQWNLVNYVVEDDQVMVTAERLAEKIASHNTMSTMFGRSCYYAANNMDYTNALSYARTELINMLWTHDARETAYAAQENRQPRYLGY